MKLSLQESPFSHFHETELGIFHGNCASDVQQISEIKIAQTFAAVRYSLGSVGGNWASIVRTLLLSRCCRLHMSLSCAECPGAKPASYSSATYSIEHKENSARG